MSTSSAFSRGARVVAVTVLGQPATRASQNAARYDLLAQVVREIRRRSWSDLDALLLPAGYFRSDEWYGPKDALQRAEQADAEEFSAPCRTMARRLNPTSPGCQVVVGVDSRKPNWGFRGDQLVIAFDARGVSGFARKIFPTEADTDGWGRAPYLLFDTDADNGSRVIKLANGARALLSVCYDAFALSELRLGPSGKRRTLRYLSDGSDCWRPVRRGEADSYLARFNALLAVQKPTVDLVAIHGFGRPGRELRWQRHGIASASAALDGALTVGAAHYRFAVPATIDGHPLAAAQVPSAHLTQGPYRRAHPELPAAGFYCRQPNSGLSALVRLFIER